LSSENNPADDWGEWNCPDRRPLLLPDTGVPARRCDELEWNSVQPGDAPLLRHGSEKCSVKTVSRQWKTERPKEEPGKKYLRALNIVPEKLPGKSGNWSDDGKESGGYGRPRLCYMEIPAENLWPWMIVNGKRYGTPFR